MRLYHFTSRANWKLIRESGQLLFTPAPVHPRKNGRGVVWLTTCDRVTTAAAMGLAPEPWAEKLSNFGDLDKTRMRITVDVPKRFVHRWDDWAPRNGGHPGFLEMVASECSAHRTWRVSTKIIPRAQWVETVDMGRVLDDIYDNQLDKVLAEAVKEVLATPQQLGFRKLY